MQLIYIFKIEDIMYRRSLSADQLRKMAHPLQIVIRWKAEVRLCCVVDQLDDD